MPDDATAVVVAGPTSDLLAPELDALEAYLAKGGKLLLMVDPPATNATPPLPLVEGPRAAVGRHPRQRRHRGRERHGPALRVELRHARVACRIRRTRSPSASRRSRRFPLARSVSTRTRRGRRRRAAARRDRRAQLGRDRHRQRGGQGRAEARRGQGRPARPHRRGRRGLAARQGPRPPKPGDARTADTKPPETRVVVVGDSDFAANVAINISGNRDLFMNIVGWLSQQENLIAIRPQGSRRPPPDAHRRPGAADRVAGALHACPGPSSALGVYTWWRRR